jgi:hypothetical protein
MKIKLVSDGTPNGTKVINEETNEPIKHVKRVSVEITPRGHTACIEIYPDTIELNGKFEVWQTNPIDQIILKPQENK